jgi:hypothetical protein
VPEASLSSGREREGDTDREKEERERRNSMPPELRPLGLKFF